MELPRLMMVTHRASMQSNSLELAWQAGARWIQWREPDFSALQVLAAIENHQKAGEKPGALVSVNAIHGSDFFNVHWPQRYLEIEHVRAPNLNGYSVHDIQSAQRAQEIGADYVVFGHVFPTLSHDAAPRGLDALKFVCQNVQIPVLAIGGVTVKNAKRCLEVGAHGIAVMRRVWRGDVATNVRALLEEIDD